MCSNLRRSKAGVYQEHHRSYNNDRNCSCDVEDIR